MKQIIHNRHSFEGDFEMIDGSPTGKGKITYYYGDLEEFKKHKLELKFDIYEGEFKKGKANGKGKLTDSGNFFTFEGNFVDDEFVEGGPTQGLFQIRQNAINSWTQQIRWEDKIIEASKFD